MEQQLSQARNEIKNIREQLHKLQSQYKRDLSEIQEQLRRRVNGKEAKVPCPVCTTVKKDRSVSATLRPPVSSDTTGAAEQKFFSSLADGSLESLPSFYSMKPIGRIESMFHNKNGTPRQPGVCPEGRAKLSISRSLFTNPAHSLVGLEKFSHIWIIFVFHKNNNAYNGAKVRPPRLDGAKVGIFSSRCPYRPNPIGLTLAKIDYIEDNVIHLRSVDILNGTPVIDIKPFIPQYDSVTVPPNVGITTSSITQPRRGDELYDETNLELRCEESQVASPETIGKTAVPDCNSCRLVERDTVNCHITCSTNAPTPLRENSNEFDDGDVKPIVYEVLGTLKDGDGSIAECVNNLELRNMSGEILIDQLRNEPTGQLQKEQTDHRFPYVPTDQSRINQPSDNGVLVADWISKPNSGVGLNVSFTPRAEQQLTQYGLENSDAGNTVDAPFGGLRHLKGAEEVRRAISAILRADPRSVYRRKNCADRLYYFSVDTLTVTCWFHEQMAEVLDIRPGIKTLDAANA